MKVVITGGCGFVGRMVAEKLVDRGDDVVLFDTINGLDGESELAKNVKVVVGDITDKSTVDNTIAGADAVIHLASMVSSGSEADFDMALRVNIDGGRNVLDACRKQGPATKVLFSSTLAVFGGSEMPQRVQSMTRPIPQNTYGMTKVVIELLVNDMTRKGYIDGRTARFPTVIVRPGVPNAAASSFASGMFREPLAGVGHALPVPRSTRMALTGHRTLVKNILILLDLPAEKLGDDRILNFPNKTSSVDEMVAALQATAAKRNIKLGPITDEVNPTIKAIVDGWATEMDAERAESLGLVSDPGLEQAVADYLDDFTSLNQN